MENIKVKCKVSFPIDTDSYIDDIPHSYIYSFPFMMAFQIQPYRQI